MSFLGDAWSSLTGQAGAEASGRAGELQRGQIQEGQQYLEGRAELGDRYGDTALEGLGNLFTGDQSYQQGMVDKAMASPMYQQQMGFKQDAEEALMRNASATGSMRGGNTQANLYKQNLRFDQSALNDAYGAQLQGMSGLVDQRNQQTGNIAGLYGQMGQSYADQTIAQQNARDQGVGNLIGIGGAVGSFFSDERLKDDVKFIGKNGSLNVYQWTWAKIAKKFGLTGDAQGYMASEISKSHPEAVSTKDGYLQVNYSMLENANA